MKLLPHRSHLLYNSVFITGLLVLAVNDHYLKLHYACWFTGKLSDFAGLLIFPMFLLYLLPRSGIKAVWLVGLLFMWWKSPLSGSFIDLYNRIAPVKICRVVDYSDLIALTVLPVSRYIILHIQHFTVKAALHPVLLLIPASLVFMATSPPHSYYFRPGGDLIIDKSFKTGLTREATFEKLKAMGYTVKEDTGLSKHDLFLQDIHTMRRPDSVSLSDSAYRRHYLSHTPQMYRLENIALPDTKDTIDYILFNCSDKYLYIEQIKFRNKVQFAYWRAHKHYAKYYDKILKSELVKEIKGE